MVTATQPIHHNLSAFDDYLRYGSDDEASKGDRTRKAYLYTVGRFLGFLDGRDPTPELARAFVKRLEEDGNKPSAVNRHIWALKSYYRFRIESGMPDSQELKMRGLKTQKHYPRFLRDREWDRLMGTANDTIYDPQVSTYARLRAKLELALVYAYGGAGLRLSEAISLQEDDILEEGFLRVTRKGGKEDFVPIEDEVIRGIRDYIESRGQNGTYIFPGKVADTPMAARTAQGIIKNLCRRAGMPDVHVHSLRHTAGYQLRKGGAPIEDIREVLGHENIQTTQIYAHLVSDELRRKLPKRFAHARQARLDWK